MIVECKEMLWRQFGASVDMLENAITLCPEVLWDNRENFWYNAYHCLFFLDYYLTIEHNSFAPPEPFTLSEFDPSGAMPERVYTKEELLIYLRFNRKKCHSVIQHLTEEIAMQRWQNGYKDYTFLELLFYNMRHVQHHAAQLNLLLRQGMNKAPNWVSEAKDNL